MSAEPRDTGRDAAGRRWAWVLGTVAAVGVVVVALALMGPAAHWWVEHLDGVPLDGDGAVTGAERQDALDKARSRIMGLGAAVLAVGALYFTAANAASARHTARAAQDNVRAFQQAQQAADEAQRRTHELTERGQLTDRFTAAVAQLGDANPAIRLGGVHALAGIAGDDEGMRQTCIDVLCAFLRLPYDPDPGDPDEATAGDARALAEHRQRRTAYRGLREVRHTIIRLIGHHLRLQADDPHSWHGCDFDFTGVIFDGGDLHAVHITSGTIDFKDATFADGTVDFRGATFAGGTVDFRLARFIGGTVDFEGATFADGTVDFKAATFADGTVDFKAATFADGTVDFEDAMFADGTVDFSSTSFDGGRVDFEDARGPVPVGLPTPGIELPGVRWSAAWLES